MARGKGGNREASPGKMRANAAAGGAVVPPVMEMQGQEFGEQTRQVAQQRASRDAASAVQRPARPTVSLDDPSEREFEPVTAGLPVGPGPGPEVLGMGFEPERDRLRDYLPTLELLASQPGSSSALRQLVRTIRGGA